MMLALTVDLPPQNIVSKAPAVRMIEESFASEPKYFSVTDKTPIRLKDNYIHLGDGRLLRLVAHQNLQFNSARNKYLVLNWGIEVSHLNEVQREMGRRFLKLYQKAKKQTLTDDEKAYWLHIVSNVDYATYCMEEEPPRYIEGELINKSPFIVRWSDGTRETIHGRVSEQLSLLERGDLFCAFVKINGENKTYHAERVYLLDDCEMEMNDWPIKK